MLLQLFQTNSFFSPTCFAPLLPSCCPFGTARGGHSSFSVSFRSFIVGPFVWLLPKGQRRVFPLHKSQLPVPEGRGVPATKKSALPLCLAVQRHSGQYLRFFCCFALVCFEFPLLLLCASKKQQPCAGKLTSFCLSWVSPKIGKSLHKKTNDSTSNNFKSR